MFHDLSFTFSFFRVFPWLLSDSYPLLLNDLPVTWNRLSFERERERKKEFYGGVVLSTGREWQCWLAERRELACFFHFNLLNKEKPWKGI